MNPELVRLASKIACNFKLDPVLVCAVCEQESSWNTYAIRYEPAFFAKYVGPLFTNNKISVTEAYSRGISWGLMQVMGQVAREKGFGMEFLSTLCDPEAGLSIGCRVLSDKIAAMAGDISKGLLAYNGGGNPNYADQVLARMANYQ